MTSSQWHVGESRGSARGFRRHSPCAGLRAQDETGHACKDSHQGHCGFGREIGFRIARGTKLCPWPVPARSPGQNHVHWWHGVCNANGSSRLDASDAKDAFSSQAACEFVARSWANPSDRETRDYVPWAIVANRDTRLHVFQHGSETPQEAQGVHMHWWWQWPCAMAQRCRAPRLSGQGISTGFSRSCRLRRSIGFPRSPSGRALATSDERSPDLWTDRGWEWGSPAFIFCTPDNSLKGLSQRFSP